MSTFIFVNIFDTYFIARNETPLQKNEKPRTTHTNDKFSPSLGQQPGVSSWMPRNRVGSKTCPPVRKRAVNRVFRRKLAKQFSNNIGKTLKKKKNDIRFLEYIEKISFRVFLWVHFYLCSKHKRESSRRKIRELSATGWIYKILQRAPRNHAHRLDPDSPEKHRSRP